MLRLAHTPTLSGFRACRRAIGALASSRCGWRATGGEVAKLEILLLNNCDIASGAGRVAWNLLAGYKARGHGVSYVVDVKHTASVDIHCLRERELANPLQRLACSMGDALAPLSGRIRGARWIRTQLQRIAFPQRFRDYWNGIEETAFPATWRLLDVLPRAPQIVHCHDLFGYFDLRALPKLSCEAPLALTLHNSWMLSGHCGHSFECERWKSGCGECPRLETYPPVRCDNTALNWRRKRDIYARSRLHVATPCDWLMDRVQRSMMAPFVALPRVIPNGVDLAVFKPRDRNEAREKLGIPKDVRIVLATADGGLKNTWKDFDTLLAAMRLVGTPAGGSRPRLMVVGSRGPASNVAGVEVRFVPYQYDREQMAMHYQAADLYIHSTKADTFPNAILEALACGKPVVATHVGGISEQVRSLDHPESARGLRMHRKDSASGILVPSYSPEALARCMTLLLQDDDLRGRLGENAARDARERFDLTRQIGEYLSWYEEIIADWTAWRTAVDPEGIPPPL